MLAEEVESVLLAEEVASVVVVVAVFAEQPAKDAAIMVAARMAATSCFGFLISCFLLGFLFIILYNYHMECKADAPSVRPQAHLPPRQRRACNFPL